MTIEHMLPSLLPPCVMSPALITQLSCEIVWLWFPDQKADRGDGRPSLCESLHQSVCLHVHTDEKCDDNPCYFLSPWLTLAAFHGDGWTYSELHLTSPHIRSKDEMKCEHFPQLMGSLCQYVKKKQTTEPPSSGEKPACTFSTSQNDLTSSLCEIYATTSLNLGSTQIIFFLFL